MIRKLSVLLVLAAVACPVSVLGQSQQPGTATGNSQPDQSKSRPEARVALPQMLAFALEHSPQIGVATARVSKAQAEIEAERPVLPSDPVLSGGVGLRRSQGRSGIDYQVGLSQEIDLAGRRGTRIRVAKAGLVAQQRQADFARWRVHQIVHALYHRAVVARERVRAATRFAEFGTRVLQVAQQRFQAGETSELPVRLAETEVAEARQALLAAQSRYRAVQLELAQASGWPLQNLPEPVEGLDEPKKAPPLARLVALAKREDPALRAARARNEAARLEVVAAERSAWPNPILGVHYERESEPGGFPSHIIGGTLSFPIPLWKGSEPEQLRARAAHNQARAEAKRTESVIEAEVARAAQAVDSSAERVQLFGKEIVPTSGKNLSLIERAFELGEIDMTQVLVARERFLRTQEAALAAYEDYYDALADLEAALGTELREDTSHDSSQRRGGRP